MSAPSVVITLPIEGRPHVSKCCMTEGEQHRLEDWLNAHPDLAELVTKALELQEAA